MKNWFKFLGIIALVAVIGFAMVGCGEGSALVGKWEAVENNQVFGETLEFFKDRTVILSESTKAEWKIDKDRIIISVFGSSLIGNYKISGSTLTLTYDGDEYIYKKVKK